MTTTQITNNKQVQAGSGLSGKLVYAYSRFSSARQATGDSFERQHEKANRWAKTHGQRVEWLNDPGVSAYHGKNLTMGQLGVFLGALRAGKLGTEPVLLVENFDRLSRQEIEAAQSFFLELINLGATVITLHNEKVYKRGMGLVDIMTALIEMDVAHQHSAKLSSRVLSALNRARAAGRIIHNRTSSPSWLTLNADRTAFLPIPERVLIVARIFELSIKGLGSEAIARVLNTEGVKPWSRKRTGFKAWYGSYVASLLRNRAVLGEHDGKEGYFGPAVVPLDVWNRVNDRARRAAAGRGKGVVTEDNLVCGLVRSGLDGTSMILRKSGVVRGGKRRVYSYLVSMATRAGKGAHRIKYDLVEGRLLSFLLNVDPEIVARARGGAVSDKNSRLKELEQLVGIHEAQCKKLLGLILDDPKPSAALVAKLKETEGLLESAKADLNQIKTRHIEVREVPEVPEDLSTPEVRRGMRAEIARWVDRIEIYPDVMRLCFDARNGIAVSLSGDESAWAYDLDVEKLQLKAADNKLVA